MPSASTKSTASFTGDTSTDVNMLIKLERENRKARQRIHAVHEREIQLLMQTTANLRNPEKDSQPGQLGGKAVTLGDVEKRMAIVIEGFVRKEEELVLQKEVIDSQWKRLTDSLAVRADPTYVGIAVWLKAIGDDDDDDDDDDADL